MNFNDRTICLTGAGRGIGLAIAHALAERGARHLIGIGRSRGGLPESIGDSLCSFIASDLSEISQIPGIASKIASEHPDCSVLINNAGSQAITDLIAPDAAQRASEVVAEIALNLTAPVVLAMHMMPQLLRHEAPAIGNITSGLALAPKRSAPVYCATKAGLSTYTRALRYQAEANAPHLQVFEALPPLVDTDMTKGRGRGKLSPEECARQIVAGMEADRPVIDIGKTKLLRAVKRVSPVLGYRILRNG